MDFGWNSWLEQLPHLVDLVLRLDVHPVHNAFETHSLTHSYSIVSQLACLLDLNTLHDLSRTCRQFRANLLQYRTMLKTLTLCCENDFSDLTALSNGVNHDSAGPRVYRTNKSSSRFTSGKVGPCARDMVGECRKCSKIVCRVRASQQALLIRLVIAD